MQLPQKSNLQKGGAEYFVLLPFEWFEECSAPGVGSPDVPFDDAGDDGAGDAKAKPNVNCTALFPQAWQKAPERLLSLLIRFLCCTGIQISPVMTTQWIWTLSHSFSCHARLMRRWWGETYQTKLRGLTEIIPSELFHYVPSETERLNLLLTRGFISSHIALGEASCCST